MFSRSCPGQSREREREKRERGGGGSDLIFVISISWIGAKDPSLVCVVIIVNGSRRGDVKILRAAPILS
jgi:hypothetical protein